MAQDQLTQTDRINRVLETLQMPTGDENLVVLTYKDGSRVHSLNHSQQNYLDQLVTKEVFGSGSKERFTMVPVASSYDAVHSNPAYRKANEEGWFHNSELILRDGFVMPDPMAVQKGDSFVYQGEKVPVKIKDTAIATLRKANLFPDTPKKGEKRVAEYGQFFDDPVFPGTAAVWSCWDGDGCCFGADAGWPSDGDSFGFAALQKSPVPTLKRPVQLGRKEYETLLEKARKYDSLSPMTKRLNEELL